MNSTYYKLSPDQIIDDISHSDRSKKIKILGKEYFIYPSVYPSDRFRTTNFLLKNIKPLVENATVCDMGCGMGIVGLYALEKGAKKVVQADINAFAVSNAKANKDLYEHSDQKLEIYQSNCFDGIPLQTFDVIIFNIPFHCEPHEIKSTLDYAFHDPDFQSTKRFLFQAQDFSHSNTKIIIAFSNKGDTQVLEGIFSKLGYKWRLWKTTNTDQTYDNRLYLLESPFLEIK
ncbi:MAG: methyltransferase [Simkaniaceae bacterium]|nr:methyltransferase [Candidatus Sacchlamyda saccharinae]